MRRYCDLHRDTELISVQPEDEFYSTTLPLPRVRFCFLDPAGITARMDPHYQKLGIVVNAEQFVDLPELLPRFEKALRQWGVNSSQPVASAIVLRSRSEIAKIFRASSGTDFYLPSDWEAAISDFAQTHEVVRYSASRVFLLSRSARQREGPIPIVPIHW